MLSRPNRLRGRRKFTVVQTLGQSFFPSRYQHLHVVRIRVCFAVVGMFLLRPAVTSFLHEPLEEIIRQFWV